MEKGLVARIVSGYGEGHYYMGMKQYKAQFKKKLGFTPYQGTLNLRARKIRIRNFLKNLKLIRIKGFKTKERTFGGLRCYKVKLNNYNIGLIIPDRTSHQPTVVELIAPFHIRQKFNLKEKKKITITP